MNIRETSSNDLDAALEMNNVNVPALNELDRTEIERLVSISAVSLTAEIEGAFAGFCIVFAPGVEYASLNYQWFSRNYTQFAYLDRIAVNSSFRRYGIGRQFYVELQRRLTGAFPVLCCEVNVRPRNDASLEFHQSIGFRDYPMVQGCILLIAVTYVSVNLVTDILYGVLDPRIRLE